MDEIFKLLNPDNTVTINRPLAHALGVNEAIIYSALIAKHLYYERHGMLDVDGYFYSTIDDLKESTTLSKHQQGVAIDVLESAGLIDFELRGMPRKRFFKVKDDKDLLEKILLKGEEIMTSLNPVSQPSEIKISPCSSQKIEQQEVKKADSKLAKNEPYTYNPNKKSKDKNPNQSIPRDEIDVMDNSRKIISSEKRSEYLELIHENIEYDCLSEKEKVDGLVAIMLDVVCSTSDTVRVNGEDMPHEVVKSRFLKLDGTHIEYVLDSMRKNTSDVRNIRAYLITALYNAPTTIDSYYTAMVNHDMYGKG